MAPAATVMIALGAVTVVLTDEVGVIALALFAAIAVLPQSALTYAARTRPVGRLDRGTATRRYAHALALHLGLSRAERRHLLAVATAARKRPPTGDAVDYVLATLKDHTPENLEAQVVTEWFNGCGGPIGLRAEAIPVAARVLAVAQTWSELTARGTTQLGHREALAHLEAAAGARLDPAVVDAARAVIAQERVSAAEPAPEPRLHRLRVPASLRRALAAA
jgi:HD domain